MVYNYVNFINIFYDKELLALNYSKLNAFILIHCGLYIIYITICFNTFEAYFSYISHILTEFNLFNKHNNLTEIHIKKNYFFIILIILN